MALKVKVTIDTKSFDKTMTKLKNAITKEVAEDVGEVVTEGMLKLIKGGISPIRGNGRFPRYKNPDKYPGDQKPKTPVNLELGGHFLNALSYVTQKSGGNYSTVIFYEGEENDKERGHRDGANGQPKRPTIPSEKGERFAATIEKEIIEIYEDAIDKASK
jgi:hypothetical protein